MRKVIVVAVREYQAAVKTKAFLVSLILMPIMMGGSIVAQTFLKDRVDISDKRVAIADFSGRLADTIVAEADNRNRTEIYKGEGGSRWQVLPKYVIENVSTANENPDQLSLKLSDRVRNRDLFAYVVINPGVEQIRDKQDKSPLPIAYHSNSPTFDSVLDWLVDVVNRRVLELRAKSVNVDVTMVENLTKRTWIANLGLVSRDPVTGVVKPAEESNQAANFILPIVMMMLMFMVIMVGATPLTQSVLEEKTNRIAEVLLGSISPFQLMLGKLIGMVGVSLTILTIYMAGGFFAMKRAGFAAFFPHHLVVWFAVYQALAVLLFGSLFIAIGAAVSDLREAQSMITPVMLIVVAPMFVWINVLREPTSTFSTVFSLIPPCTPMLMILRQAVPPGIPMWQPVLGGCLVLLTTILCVLAAGRIFRVGILMQGRGAKVGEMLSWVFKG